MKPRLLDLFCGAGGASMGYYRAGFEVVGVDNKPQPHYPFEFIQRDALEIMDFMGKDDYILGQYGTHYYLSDFATFHASPPCQKWSKAFSQLIGHRKEHPDLLSPTRTMLLRTSKPFVIENVIGAPLENYIQLEGTMFGLKVKKARNFELHGLEIWLLPSKFYNTRGMIKTGKLVGIVQHSCYPDEKVKREHLAVAYEMEWGCTHHELRQAIPPAYTEYIGKHIIKVIQENK